MSKSEEKKNQNETKRWLGEQKIRNSEYEREHCQFTGKQRGAAHKACTLFIKQKLSSYFFFCKNESQLFTKTLALKRAHWTNID